MYEDEVDSPLQYIEQISWIIFLRYLDNLEKEKEEQFLLQGKHYSPIIKDQFQWRNWAVPRNEVGEIDHNSCITGEDLTAFINDELFPYLSSFSNGDFPAESLEYQIGVFFSDRKNLLNSGYKMRDILEQADDLSFNSQEEKDEITFLFESNLKDMGNAGRSGGKYYTPRPLIQAMIEIINPQFGEKIYDPALGSAGFLCESYTYLKDKVSNTNEMELLQKHMLFGKEKSRLSYSLGVMNMILHGIESPNVLRTNTLEENIRDIQEKDRFDIILANPPFGGNEDVQVRQNFKYQTGETATLFFQHFLKSLKQNGRAAIIIKNTFLTNDNQATVAVRKELLESCNLDIILDLPQKSFQAGVRTVVLFFKKGSPTKSIWYYQLDPGRNLGKTNPLNSTDFKEFLSLKDSKPETKRSWNLSMDTVNKDIYDLGVSNPNLPKEAPLRSPEKILEEIKSFDSKKQSNIKIIEKIILNDFFKKNQKSTLVPITDLVEIISGQSPQSKYYNFDEKGLPFYQGKKLFQRKYIREPNVWTTKTTKVSLSGDILMSVRAPVGDVNINNVGDICIGRGLAAFRVGELLDRDFLFYFLLYFKEKLTFNLGATISSINRKQLSMIKIPKINIDEQIRIVENIKSLEQKISLTTKHYENEILALNDLKYSVLEKTFNGE